MTLLLAAFVLSILGAALFFAAGDFWSRLRRTSYETQALATMGAEIEATRAHMLEQEQSKLELRANETPLGGDLARLEVESEQLRTDVARARSQAEALERELATAHTELKRAREKSS